MARNPKPLRKKAAVTTRSARTPDGKKVTYQTSRTERKPVVGDDGKPALDKQGKPASGSTVNTFKGVKKNSDMKKAIRTGQIPATVTGDGKGKNPAVKAGKEGPSFKKKKP
jgi:hypothetical protein